MNSIHITTTVIVISMLTLMLELMLTFMLTLTTNPILMFILTLGGHILREQSCMRLGCSQHPVVLRCSRLLRILRSV